MKALWLVVVGGVAAGCTDSRCSAQNVKAVIDHCRVAPIGPDLGACEKAWGVSSSPPTVDLTSYFQADCSAWSDGPLIQCLADKAGECSPTAPDGNESVINACDAQIGSTSTSTDCSAACEATRMSCVANCTSGLKQPLTNADYTGCLDCTDNCAHADAQCTGRCPQS